MAPNKNNQSKPQWSAENRTHHRCAVMVAPVLAGGSEPSGSAMAHANWLVRALQRCPVPAIAAEVVIREAVSVHHAATLIVVEPAASETCLESIEVLRKSWPLCALVAMGANLNGEQLSAALTAGAHDFISLPTSDAELHARLRHALGVTSLIAPQPVRAELSPRLRDFVGSSAAFTHVVSKIPVLAGCDAGVLIRGETGTGKEVCAQAIHYLSARAARPWVAVNCGAIPVDLLESELFGHVRGAYTNAHTAREGLVAEAEGGTLFLDDVDCLPISAQSKLLRFLQEHEYRPVGANAVRRADVRVVAATNRDLAAMAASGAFRPDLYYRLNVLTLVLPPLRNRRGDIPELAQHFTAQCCKRFGSAAVRLSPLCLARLLQHDWPGNVRELQHVIERAVLLATHPTLSGDDIDITGTAEQPADAQSFQSAKSRVVEQFERSYIEQLLASCDGNITRAADEARKNRRAFFALMQKHHIDPQRFRARI